MSHGWAGQILRVDLTEKKVTKQPLPIDWGARFLGASGINDWILWNEVPPEIGPLDPENRIIFGAGPFIGTTIPVGSRTHVTSRSPLTGIFGDGNGGGFWSAWLKFAGYDNLVVHGKADAPVYLFIDNDRVSIRDASKLWGQDVYQTVDALKKELGSDVSVACIGPAGENLVRFANVMIDKYRAAAKTGTGCVMGSKNLKAIAVRGTNGITVAKPDEVERMANTIKDSLNPNLTKGIAHFAKYGTTFLVDAYNHEGCLSVRNYQEQVDSEIDKVSPDKFIEKYVQGSFSCSINCPVSCCHWWEIKDGKYAGEVGAKPEYIIIDSMGMHLGVHDWPAILHFQNLINRMGVDSTEMGTGIGLLMELWQHGILTAGDTGGVKLDWGNVESIEQIVVDAAHARGTIGNLLHDGTVAASRKIGHDAEKYVCSSKGLTEIEDVRGYPHWALGYAISSRGADHLKAHGQMDKNGRRDLSQAIFGVPDVGDPYTTTWKGHGVKYHEDLEAVMNSLGGCMFNFISLSMKYNPKLAVKLWDYAPMFSAVTGVEMSGEEFSRTAERIVLLEKSYNARLGISRKDDTLHGRWMNEPCPQGPGKGRKVEDYLEGCLDEYYEARGFDVKTGLPTTEKLHEVGLDDVAQDLSKRGII